MPTGIDTLSGRMIGAYVGIASGDYEALCRYHGASLTGYSFTAAAHSVASGRLSFVYGLKGPAASVDTACSASLVAAHMACAAFGCVIIICIRIRIRRIA